MTDDHHKRDFAISSGWVLVMVVPLCVIVLWIAIDHANTNRDHAQARSNQQFAKALIVTDRKFRQALDIATQQFAYVTNKSVCGFRKLADDGIVRAQKVLKDPTAPHASRVAARKAIQQARAFKLTQVTVPSDFDCATLPKNPPEPGPA